MRSAPHRDRGNATILTIIVVLMALPLATLPLVIVGAADARSRAVAAADLIALAGCEHLSALNRYHQTEVVACTDDGISVSVQTRTRIPWVEKLGLSMYVHAQAQAVHAL